MRARLHRHRRRGGVLDVDLEVVLEVLAHARQVVQRPPTASSARRSADPRELQQLGRVEGAGAEDHLARAIRSPDPPRRPRRRRRGRPRRPAGVRSPAAHLEVAPVRRPAEVGAGGVHPPAVEDRAVEAGEALLAVAVDVGGQLVAGLLDGGEERLVERAGGRAPLEHDRAVGAAVGVGAGEAGLHALEVRQAVCVVPGLEPRFRGPALVVERVPALEDHPVDAARAAEQLAAGVVDAPAVHERLRLRAVHPVVAGVADREGERGRHLDVEVPEAVGPAGLEHEHARAGVGAEAVREHAAGRAAADDHDVVGHAGEVRERPRPISSSTRSHSAGPSRAGRASYGGGRRPRRSAPTRCAAA